MSSRQRSSFESGYNKANQKWQGDDNRNLNNKFTTDSLPKSGVPTSPTKASSQSRSKPKSFQFGAGGFGSLSHHPEKENDTDDALRKSHSPEKEHTVATPKMSQTKVFPSTPAMRLPLADLVGNAEEALRRHDEPKEQSPEEQIGWIANSSHPDLTPRQKRRRAQSSSPVTSSQDRSDQYKDTLDLKNIQLEMKTPRTISDPAAELWSRYAIGKGIGEDEARLPSFAHLIDDSSPRSGPRTPAGSVGGLRRWASCGMDFPASKAKRRRTNGVFRDRSGLQQELDEQKPMSKVSMLIEKVQASLAQPSHLRRDAPSSSSPLPDKGDFPDIPQGSPLLRTGRLSQIDRLSQRSNLSLQSHRSPEAETDEFGDEDLDLDMDQAVQIAPIPTTSAAFDRQTSFPTAPYQPRHHEKREPIQRSVSVTHQQPQRLERLPPSAPIAASHPPHVVQNGSHQAPRQDPEVHLASIAEELEEFGDAFGDDEFGDDDLDLEDLVSAVPIFDSRPDSRHQSNDKIAVERSEFESPNPSRAVSPPAQLHQPTAYTPTNNRQAAVQQQQEVSVDLTGFSDDDDDDFGGSDLDDESFAQAEYSATQAAHQASGAATSPHNPRKSRAIQRYLVKQVIEGQYTNEKGRTSPEKVLVVEDENNKRAKAITLRQSWFETHCTPGSYVHVVGSFTSAGQITIDDANNLLIVHPDHLISATVVADSFECIRRAVLQDRVKATNTTNESNVYGTILHEVFQEALKANKWDVEWLDELAETTLSKFLEKLFELGHEGTGKALEHLRSKMPELSSWARAFVKAKPGPDAVAEDRNGKKIRLSITKLLDVEEHVWSPTYGLKGNIDATVQAVMHDEEGERALTVPFEVKTGRNTSSTSHRAQTALYTLLLSDRYDIDIIYGVLYYMETSAIARVPAIRNELRQMIMQRNELASYVRERLQLPPMLQNPNKCGRCYAKTQCFLYHKLAEGGTTETAGVKEKFDELVGKLQPAHQQFFKKWDDLLTKEESEMMKFRRELWTMLSKEREKLGRCFSEVIIEPGSSRENDNMAKINRFSYTFNKKQAVPGFSFTESQLAIGEPIVISSEQGHFALANGYVTKVSRSRISVAVDRRLYNASRKLEGFNSQTNQNFVGIMEVEKEKAAVQDIEETQVYRLDKDEFSNGMSTVRNNLLSIMDDSVYRSSDLRSLIVENKDPIFKPVAAKYNIPDAASMNPDQLAAIEKVMTAQDYALVLGMPGTGKTTTIASIIRALAARGKSVLLTSYTHTAVDNILLKLRSPKGKKQEISIMRLGTVSKIHPDVQDFATLAATPKDSLEEIYDSYMTPQVVATTCLGVSHFLFQKRVFDYCIVDEASQITLPVCLGPIRMARTFVLVGDHYQLPPLVQNKEALDGGLDVSLFKSLSDNHPEAVVELGRQYRMCEEIQLLSNTLIYSGKLQCGNEAVAKRTLTLPNFPGGLDRYHQPSHPSTASWDQHPTVPCPDSDSPTCWLNSLLDPSRKVVFANTDTLSPAPRENNHSRRITNATEAQLVTQLVLSLLSSGVPATEIGVITFYRSQLALLRQTVKTYSSGLGLAAENLGVGAVEMHTADKFQGRDKEVVIVSFVRSNDAGNVGDLLRDWRRINVAVTRARSKLVMLGSKNTLAKDPLLEKLLGLLWERGWGVGLPGDAERCHGFEVGGTGLSMPTPRKTPRRDGVGMGLAGIAEEENEEEDGDEGVGVSKARKALSMRKGIENYTTRNGISRDRGKENDNTEDVETGFEVGGISKDTKTKKMKPFKVPQKIGKVGPLALESKMKGNAVLRDIVNDALGGVEVLEVE